MNSVVPGFGGFSPDLKRRSEPFDNGLEHLHYVVGLKLKDMVNKVAVVYVTGIRTWTSSV